MKDTLKIKYWLDLFMLLALLGTGFTGMINIFILDGATEIFGISSSTWFIIHPIFGVLTASLVVVHLFLHIDWIRIVTKKIFGKNNGSES